MKTLDPQAIYTQGLSNLVALVGPERLVFQLQDFDNLMEMEGWSHFFLYEHHFAWYAEMKDWLRQIGDEGSITVLRDFEAYVQSLGVDLSPTAIEALLDADDDEYQRRCDVWRDRYCELRESRWNLANAFLTNQGFDLKI